MPRLDVFRPQPFPIQPQEHDGHAEKTYHHFNRQTATEKTTPSTVFSDTLPLLSRRVDLQTQIIYNFFMNSKIRIFIFVLAALVTALPARARRKTASGNDRLLLQEMWIHDFKMIENGINFGQARAGMKLQPLKVRRYSDRKTVELDDLLSRKPVFLITHVE